MARWPGRVGLAVLGTLLGGGTTIAATSSRTDILSDDALRNSTDTIDVGAVKPIARPAQPANKPVPRGNPLWSVPLSALTATQERPIFSSTRRPPPRAVATPPVGEAEVSAPPKPADEPPPLVLVGAVVGEGDAIAILVDQTDQKVIRMRQGETRRGWSLSSVQAREVTFKQGDRSEVLALRRLDGPPAAPSASTSPGGKLTTPVGGDASFAPFVPRSTPKNGESDGL